MPGWGRAALTAHRSLANELLGAFMEATREEEIQDG